MSKGTLRVIGNSSPEVAMLVKRLEEAGYTVLLDPPRATMFKPRVVDGSGVFHEGREIETRFLK